MKTARGFNSGNSQAVRPAKELRLEGGEVYIKRVSGGLLLMQKDDPFFRPLLRADRSPGSGTKFLSPIKLPGLACSPDT